MKIVDMPESPSTNAPLTRAEEAVMKALWQEEPAFVRDIIAAMPLPSPHPNTVNTVLKVLTEKGYVASEAVGNANRYHARVPKEDYRRRTVSQLVKGYFNGSFADLVSSFVAGKDMNIADLEEVLRSLKKSKK